MQRLAAIMAVALIAFSGCGDGEDAGNKDVACGAVEDFPQALQRWNESIDEGSLDGIEAGRENVETIRERIADNAPARVGEAFETIDGIESDTVRISEQKRRDQALDTINAWIRSECDLSITF